MVTSFPVGKLQPSLSYYIRYLFRHIITHPLIIKPVIYDEISGERIKIAKYRFFNGIEIKENQLVCSIFPHSTPTDSYALPKPNETSTSVLYETENLGSSTSKAIYHIALKLHYVYNFGLGIDYPDILYRTTNIDSVIDPSQDLLVNNTETEVVNLVFNPATSIISDYLELLRLVILDKKHLIGWPFAPTYLNVLYINVKEGPWEKDKKLLFHEGEMLLRLDRNVSNEWRGRFNEPIQDIRFDFQ